jgi:hypothetical protein
MATLAHSVGQHGPSTPLTLDNATFDFGTGAVRLSTSPHSIADYGPLLVGENVSGRAPAVTFLSLDLRRLVAVTRFAGKAAVEKQAGPTRAVKFERVDGTLRMEQAGVVESYSGSLWYPVGLSTKARPLSATAEPGDWLPSLPTFERAVLGLVELLSDAAPESRTIRLGPQSVWADPTGLYFLDAGEFSLIGQPRAEPPGADDVRRLIELYLSLWGKRHGIANLVKHHLPPSFWGNWDSSRGLAGVRDFIEHGQLRVDPDTIRWRHWLASQLKRLCDQAEAQPEVKLGTNPWPIDAERFDPSRDLRSAAGLLQLEQLPKLPDPLTKPSEALDAVGRMAEVARERWVTSRRWVAHLWHAAEQVVRQRDVARKGLEEARATTQALDGERAALAEKVGRLETTNAQLRKQASAAEQQRDAAASDRERYRTTAERAGGEAALLNQKTLDLEQQLRNAEVARKEADGRAAKAVADLNRMKKLQKDTNRLILELAAEIVGGLAVAPGTRLVALLFDIALLVAAAIVGLHLWKGPAWPSVSSGGLTCGAWSAEWPLVAWVFAAVLAVRSILSPGRWLTGVHPQRVRPGKPVETLDAANKLFSGVFQYAPIVAALWYASSIAPAVIDTTGLVAAFQSLGAAGWVYFGIGAWFLINALAMAARHFDEQGNWFRGATLIEHYLLGIGFSRCRVDEMERFTRLTAALGQDSC